MSRDNHELRWVAVDLDKTVADNSGFPEFKLTAPTHGAKEALDKLTANGWKIIIHTARAWENYEEIEVFLNKYEIPFRRIVCGKLLAKYYVDDRGVEFTGNWGETLDKIL